MKFTIDAADGVLFCIYSKVLYFALRPAFQDVVQCKTESLAQPISQYKAMQSEKKGAKQMHLCSGQSKQFAGSAAVSFDTK